MANQSVQQKLLVSVIIPAFNRPDEIRDAVLSVVYSDSLELTQECIGSERITP